MNKDILEKIINTLNTIHVSGKQDCMSIIAVINTLELEYSKIVSQENKTEGDNVGK